MTCSDEVRSELSCNERLFRNRQLAKKLRVLTLWTLDSSRFRLVRVEAENVLPKAMAMKTSKKRYPSVIVSPVRKRAQL